MIKIKTTKKYIKKSYNNIYNVGYDNMHYLLTGIEPRFCNVGVYGWNWNGYELTENICIITGYRNTLGENVDREELASYEKQAREIFKNYELKYDEKYQKIKKLRNKFIKKVLNK